MNIVILYNYIITHIKNSSMKKIVVNGKTQEIEEAISVLDLIKINKVLQPEMVSVQLNQVFVNREDFKTSLVDNGDEIDFLYFMGGGSF
jgi:thiamine biosynthesis protein ThiS